MKTLWNGGFLAAAVFAENQPQRVVKEDTLEIASSLFQREALRLDEDDTAAVLAKL